MEATELRAHIRRLSVAERMALVDEIWESLRDDPAAVEVTAAQRAELDRRIEASAMDPAASAPWSVVRERLRSGR